MAEFQNDTSAPLTSDPMPNTADVFKRLTVDVHFNPIVNNQVLVEWALDPSFIAVGPYTFTLYCSQFPSQSLSECQPVARVVDQPWAYDRNPSLSQKGNQFFYKVVLEDGDGKTYISQAVSGTSYWGPYDWKLAREIIRKETMLLRKRTGTRGYLFKRRTFGDRCECVDPDTLQIMNPDCDTCYGTGFVGGYYPPFEYWVSMNPTQQVRKLDAQAGLLTENIESVRALAYPQVDANDFWVHAETDQRYIVEGKIDVLARHRGINLIVKVDLDERSRSEALYKVPVPCGA